VSEIVGGPYEEQTADPSQDSDLFRWRYKDGDDEHDVLVLISRTAMNSDFSALPSPIGVTVRTKGRAAVEDALRRGRTPKIITVSTGGLWEDPTAD
jgi:hypothetical protein